MQRSILLVAFFLVIGLAGAAVFGWFDGEPSPPGLDPAAESGGGSTAVADGAMTAAESGDADDDKGERAAAVEASSTQREEIEFDDGVPRIEVTGRLIAKGDGNPLPGVEVELQPIPEQWARYFDPDQPNWRHWTPTEEDLERRMRSRTSADGSFYFRVRAGRPGLLQVVSEEHVFAAGRIVSGASREDVALGDCEGVPASVVTGTVVDAAGQPVSGAKVDLRDGTQLGMWNQTSLAEAKSDEAGAYRLGHLVAGVYKVRASAVGFAPTEHDVKLEESGAQEGLEFVLEKGRQLTGVVHNDLGRAVVGAKVVATLLEERRLPYGGGEHKFTMPGAALPAVKTDAQGRYTLIGLKGEKVNLKIEAEGHLSEAQRQVALDSGLLSSTLVRAGRIEGRVVDAQGNGIEGSKVMARTARKKGARRGDPSYRSGHSKQVETDAEGRFVLPDARPGDVTVHATGPHLAGKSPVQALLPGGSIQNLELRVERGQSLTVKVRSPDGKPVADADVSYLQRYDTKPRPAQNGRQARPSRVRYNNAAKAKSDADGVARLHGIKVGRGKITARHSDFVTYTGEEFPVTAGSTSVREHTVRMLAGGMAKIMTHSSDGSVQGGMSFVVAKIPDDPKRDIKSAFNNNPTKGRSDSAGSATIGPLVAGEYVVAIRRAADKTSTPFYFGSGNRALTTELQRFHVVAGEQVGVSIRAPSTSRVVGRAVDAGGTALTGTIMLKAMPMSGQPRTVGLKDGAFSFDEVENGKYLVEYRPTKGLPMSQEVAVIGAADHRVELVYRTGQVRVTVTDPDGKPQAEASVSISSKQSSSGQVEMLFLSGNLRGSTSVKTDAKGVATIAAPAGSYTVRISHQSHVAPPALSVDVAVDAVIDRSAQLLRGGALVVKLPRGVVQPANDRIWAMATLIPNGPSPSTGANSGAGPGAPGPSAPVSRPGRRMNRNQTMRKGTARFDRLVPGRYRVHLRGRSSKGEPREIDVTAGATAELECGLPK